MSLEEKDAIQGVKGVETVLKTRMGSTEHKQGWGQSSRGAGHHQTPWQGVWAFTVSELWQVALAPTRGGFRA